MAITPKGSTYSDSRFGIVRRQKSPLKIDIAAAGTHADTVFNFPKKSTLLKFGVISSGSDVVCTTTTGFELRNSGGTRVATFVPGAVTIGSWDASGAAPETATSINQNVGLVACVGSVVGDSGSVYFFVDYVEDFDGSS